MSKDDTTKKKGGFALGALFGAAAGAITGLLFAPKRGDETRAELKQKARQAEGEIKERSTTARAKVQGTAAEVKQNSSRLGKKAKGVASATKAAITAETKTGSKLRQKEAEARAKDLKSDVKRTVKKTTKK